MNNIPSQSHCEEANIKMPTKDYYKILGVEKGANEKDIKAAYRKKARQWHPDVNPGNNEAEERFKEISEAYEVLSDDKKRRQYDMFGTVGQGGGPNFQEGFQTIHFDLNDIFGNFFGGGGVQTGPRMHPPQNLEYEMDITLEEAFAGVEKSLTLAVEELGENGTPMQTTRKVKVKIPAGIGEGQRVRVAGQGIAGSSGRRGDLMVNIHILPHKRFTREGDNLIVSLPVFFTVAALGGKADVPTLGKSVKMTVPPGTQTDQKFRLRGEGMPRIRGGGRGDLYAVAKITVPKQISPKQRELLAQLADMGEK